MSLPKKQKGFYDQAFLLLGLAVLFWAGNAILGRAVRTDIPPIGLAFWRWTLATIIFFPFAWKHLKKDLPIVKENWKIITLLSFLGVGVFNTLLYTGLQSTTSVNAVLLQASMSALVLVQSRLLFKEKIRALQVLGIIIAFLGVAIIVFQGSTQALMAFRLNKGDAIIFIAVVFYASYTVLLKKRPKMHPFSFVLITFIFALPMILPIYLFETFTYKAVTLSTTTFLSFAYVAIFPSILSYIFYNRGVELIGANRAGLISYLTPVLGSILAILLLGESFRWFHAAGILLIMAGVFIATRLKKA